MNALDPVRAAPRLRAGDIVDRDELHAASAAVAAHPSFDDVARHFARQGLDSFARHWFLSRLMHDVARYAIVTLLLHAAHRERHHGERPLTLAELQKHLSFGRFAGPSRVKLLVQLLRMGRLVEAVRAPDDARVRWLRPTPRLRQPVLAWYRADLQAVERIYPLPLAPASAHDDLIDAYMSLNARPFLRDGFILPEGLDPVLWFIGRDCGYLLLMSLIAHATPGLWPEVEVHSEARIGELAPRYYVSRSHFHHLLSQAARAGWLQMLEPGGRRVRLSPAFVAVCREWMAREIAWMGSRTLDAIDALAVPRDARAANRPRLAPGD